MNLLVLLGHENDSCGGLSAPAKSRCARAAQILNADQSLVVLPTGAYGAFNLSSVAHGIYLRNCLIEMGIDPGRILPHTNSANTIEDALCARKVAVDGGYQDIVVVTSQFHMPRVQFIFDNVFPDKNVRFEGAVAENIDSNDVIMKKEAERMQEAIEEWVQIPLYQKQCFPIHIYENASSEQKHYDTVSMAIVTAMFVTFVYPYTSFSYPSLWTVISILLSGIIVVCLLIMYDLTAQTARTARRVLARVEVSFGCPGFSASHRRQGYRYRGREPLKRVCEWLNRHVPYLSLVGLDPGIRGIVVTAGIAMATIQFILSIVLLFIWIIAIYTGDGSGTATTSLDTMLWGLAGS